MARRRSASPNPNPNPDPDPDPNPNPNPNQAGILNLLLSPFIMTLMLFYFLLKHAEEIHGHRAKVRLYPGPQPQPKL